MMCPSRCVAQTPCNTEVTDLDMPFWAWMRNQYILITMLALGHMIRTRWFEPHPVDQDVPEVLDPYGPAS